MSVNVQFIESYENYGRCVSIRNGKMELLVTVDVGPRIISMTLGHGKNLLFNDLERNRVIKGPAMDEWFGEGAVFNFYGGHRLWLAPQHEIKTCIPDNNEVSCVICENGAVFTPRPMDPPGVQEQLRIVMDPRKAEFSVTAEITGLGYRPRTFAPWQITQMAPGGLAILPFHRGKFDPTKTLVPRRQLVYFDFCDTRDERMYVGNDYITVRQDPEAQRPFKIGSVNRDGWCMYVVDGVAITKRFDYDPAKTYTDGGVNCELYTDRAFFEIESLGAYESMEMGQTISQTEVFSLCPVKNEPAADDEAAIAEFLKECGVE